MIDGKRTRKEVSNKLNLSERQIWRLVKRVKDNGTSKVLSAYMCEHECLLGYLETLMQMLKNYGIPKCLYLEKFSVKAKSEENYFELVPNYIDLDLLLSIKLTKK